VGGVVVFEIYKEKRPLEVEVRSIFQTYTSTPTFFKNKDILTPNWSPSQIIHREEEILHLTKALAPALKGYQPNNIFIYGTVGTGKTITTIYVLNELNRVLKENGKKTQAVYLNCKMRRVADTEYRLLAAVLKEFGISVPETGVPTNSLYKKLWELLEEKSIILALDEIDTLFKKIGDDFLYNLTRCDRITIIGIANNLIWKEGLDPRVQSSLAEEEIIFKPYNALQLYDILQLRAAQAFIKPPSEAVLRKCAALAAAEHGDARRALELLRVATEIAERNASKEVTEEHVNLAQEKISRDRLIEAIHSQPIQSRLLLSTILHIYQQRQVKSTWNDRRILSTEVYQAYIENCGKNGLKPLTLRRVSDMINELEMLGIIRTHTISRGRYGRAREIILCIDNTTAFKLSTNLSLKV
jgi:cell division control protein 6